MVFHCLTWRPPQFEPAKVQYFLLIGFLGKYTRLERKKIRTI